MNIEELKKILGNYQSKKVIAKPVCEEREQKIQNFKEVIKVLENNMLDDIYTNVEKNFFKEEIIKFLNELVKITM